MVGGQRKPAYCNQDPEERLGASWWLGRVAGFAAVDITWKGRLLELSHGKDLSTRLELLLATEPKHSR